MNLAGAMIFLGKKTKSLDEGIEDAIRILKSVRRLTNLLKLLKHKTAIQILFIIQNKYPKSKFSEIIKANSSGYLSSVNNYDIGMAALELGAGRKTKDDKIDPKAGIIFNYKIGDTINKGCCAC